MKRNALFIALGTISLLLLLRLRSCVSADSVPEEARRHFEVVGYRSAELLGDLVGDGARVLVLVTEGEAGHLEARVAGFRAGADARRLEVVGVVEVPPEDTDFSVGLSREFHDFLAQTYGDVRGVVSFAGPPPLRYARGGPPPAFRPRWVAVFPNLNRMPLYFQSGLVDAAILPGGDAAEEAPGPHASNHDWFDAYFHIRTPDPSDRDSSSPPPH